MINLTFGDVSIRAKTGEVYSYPPSGHVARVLRRLRPAGAEGGCPCARLAEAAELPCGLPDGIRAVRSEYYDPHNGCEGYPITIYLRVPDSAVVAAVHGPRSRSVSVNGVELIMGEIEDIEFTPQYIVCERFARAYRAQHGHDGIELFTPSDHALIRW